MTKNLRLRPSDSKKTYAMLLKLGAEDCLNTGLLEDLCEKNEGKGLVNGQTDRQKEIATPLKVLSELKKHE